MAGFREDALRRIRHDGEFDALVIGGGINGIGAYRDLALQGLRVLLVDRGDFAAGCSAAPSRMIHGGLRYLENGEFSLVAESLKERDALLQLAPHMVHPLPTTIPILSTFSGMFNAAATFVGSGGKPSMRGALPIKIGLWLYDFVTRKNRVLPRHEFRGVGATMERWPELTRDIKYSATYYDAWIQHPERLALELLIDTEADAPQSIALNYAEISRVDDGYKLCIEGSDEMIDVRPRIIINATGAWVDRTIEVLGVPNASPNPIVSGTKGSHLIIENEALRKALDGNMIFFENTDNRVCIMFPYLGRVLAGSTDIKVDRPQRVRCEPEERDYILESIRYVFPNIEIKQSEIVFSFSGIRPLPRSDAEFTGRISRSHFIHKIDGNPPQLCMIGGKWTTFRAFGEQVADEVLQFLGKKRVVSTLNRYIGGGRNFPGSAEKLAQSLIREFAIQNQRADYLATNYGSRAFDLMRYCQGRPDDVPFSAGQVITAAEVSWLIRQEHVLHLSDIILRRTTLAIRGEINIRLLDQILQVAARELDWTAERTATERQSLIEELEAYYGVTAAMLQDRSKENA